MLRGIEGGKRDQFDTLYLFRINGIFFFVARDSQLVQSEQRKPRSLGEKMPHRRVEAES